MLIAMLEMIEKKYTIQRISLSIIHQGYVGIKIYFVETRKDYVVDQPIELVYLFHLGMGFWLPPVKERKKRNRKRFEQKICTILTD